MTQKMKIGKLIVHLFQNMDHYLAQQFGQKKIITALFERGGGDVICMFLSRTGPIFVPLGMNPLRIPSFFGGPTATITIDFITPVIVVNLSKSYESIP